MQKLWARCCDRGGEKKERVLVIRSGPRYFEKPPSPTTLVMHSTVQVTVEGHCWAEEEWTCSGAFTSLRVKLLPRRLRPCTLGGALV
jgi:hypothetical protein